MACSLHMHITDVVVAQRSLQGEVGYSFFEVQLFRGDWNLQYLISQSFLDKFSAYILNIFYPYFEISFVFLQGSQPWQLVHRQN